MSDSNMHGAKPHPWRSTLWLMTIASGMVVANIYYNQPLLVKKHVPAMSYGTHLLLTHAFAVDHTTGGKTGTHLQLLYFLK